MRGFFDSQCKKGHRYGWQGGMSQDPGCPTCRQAEEAKAAAAKREPSVPLTGEQLLERAREITGADREETLRRCVSHWLRAHGGKVS